jgi:hypothetical protein
MVRNAMFRRVELVARDDVDGLAALDRADADRTDPPRPPVWSAEDWDSSIGEYYDEHDRVGTGPDARGPDLLAVEVEGRTWRVRQTLDDPEGHRDWVVEALVDLEATAEVGEPVLQVQSFRRLG